MLEGNLLHSVAQLGRGLFGRLILDKLDANHEANAAHFAHAGVAFCHQSERGQHVVALRLGVAQAAVLKHVNRRKCGGAGQRVAAVGVAVRTGRHGHHALLAHKAAQWQTAGNTLGRAHDVRLHTPMLNGPPAARTPHARLHLVGNQQNSVLVAHFAQPREEVGGWHHIAAFALNRLHQNPGHIAGRGNRFEDDLLEVVDNRIAIVLVAGLHGKQLAIGIGVGDVRHITIRCKAAPLRGLARRKVERTLRAPVETAQETNEALPPGVIARRLDGPLHSLRARVAQEDIGRLIKGRNLVQALAQLHPLGMVEVGRNVQELLGLLLNRAHDVRVAVARRIDGNAGHKVEVAVAVDVEDLRAAPVVHDKIGHAPVGRCNHLAIALKD